jgi:hypothetical protein
VPADGDVRAFAGVPFEGALEPGLPIAEGGSDRHRTSVPSSISRYQSLVWQMGPGYLRGGMIRGFSREAD